MRTDGRNTRKSRFIQCKKPPTPVGVVLAGAGARGAYEAGMLSVLLPVLGDAPKVFVGTSAGAINAALFASLAHLRTEDAAKEVLRVWQNIQKSMVVGPALSRIPRAILRYGAGLLGLPGRVLSLLDASPLMGTLQTEELMDWQQLHDNVTARRVAALAVVTTEIGTGRTKVFWEGDMVDEKPRNDDDRAIDFVPTREIKHNHVAASAAIPIAFPPVRLGSRDNASWHMDGGVRLNAPLKPALALGAKSLVVIATDPAEYRSAGTGAEWTAAPSMQDVVGQIAHSVLNDPMIEDIKNLAVVNDVLAGSGGHSSGANGSGYERIPFIFGGPESNEAVGDRAGQALEDLLHGARRMLHPDLAVLHFLLGVRPDSRSDLMSFVLFEQEFIDRAICMGQRDAERMLTRGQLWRTGWHRRQPEQAAPGSAASAGVPVGVEPVDG